MHEVEHWMTSAVHSPVCEESCRVSAACLISYVVGMPPSLVVLELERQWHLYKMVSVDGRPMVRLRQPFLSSSISFLSHFLGFVLILLTLASCPMLNLILIVFIVVCFFIYLFWVLFLSKLSNIGFIGN